MPGPDTNLLVAARTGIDLIGVQRRNFANMPSPIRRVLQLHHAESGALQPVIGAGFILSFFVMLPRVTGTWILRTARTV